MKNGSELLIKEVVKRYGDRDALRDITLEIPPGTLLTLLGPSGCGKTTLLKIISGFLASDQGHIFIDGDDVSNLPPFRRPTSLVFQEYSLFPHMTLFENIAFGLRLRHVNSAEIQRRVRSALEMVQLGAPFEDKFPAELSGGQKQRVAIARSLVIQPKILLMDEPFSALDKSLREQLQLDFRDIQQELGITTVFVTHDQEEAMVISDAVAVLNDGIVEQHSSPQEVYSAPQSRFVARFIGNNTLMRVSMAKHTSTGQLLAVSTDDTCISHEQYRCDARGLQYLAIPADDVVVRPALASALVPADKGITRFEGVISSVRLLGRRIMYKVDVPDIESVTSVMNLSVDTLPMRKGANVCVDIDVSGASLIPSVEDGDDKC